MVSRSALHRISRIAIVCLLISGLVGVLPLISRAAGEGTVITFDLSKGSVAFGDESYSGVGADGNAVSGTHDPSNRYVIRQSSTAATTNTVSVGTYSLWTKSVTADEITVVGSDLLDSKAVTKSFVIVLDGVNVQTSASQTCAFSVNNKGESVVAVILKGENRLYSANNRAGLEKSGGITSDGTLVIACEAGYAAWLQNGIHGHTLADGSSACTDACGSLDARSGNAWNKTTSANTYYSGAGIGSCGNGRNGEKVTPYAGVDNALLNLTIAGGRITAIGGRGSSTTNSTGGAACIGTGSALFKEVVGGGVQNLLITGGSITAHRCDNSAACIGGGYRSGYVTIEIYGGTVVADNNTTSLTKVEKVRAPGIGGGGGGTSSSSPEGATIRIFGGNVTAEGQYGAAIGAGAGGSSGHATPALVEITGGVVTATTTKGDGNGAGAAIGTGGSLGTGYGGQATVLISGGNVTATSELGADIGGGGTNSSFSNGKGGEGIVTVSDGVVNATKGGIGGGRANAGAGGDATVFLSGGVINASMIGGGNSVGGVGGTATVTVEGTASITLTGGIGGGDSEKSKGGDAILIVNGGSLTCGTTIGGGTSEKNNGGTATVTVNGGSLKAKSIGGGEGGTSGNGGAAEIYLNQGTVVTGSIGGGDTKNASGKIGYAKAEIHGGDIIGQFIMAEGGTEPCTFTMTGGTLHSVNATLSSYSQKNGGAVYMDDPNGIAEISGGVIESCTAEKGGAVYMTAGHFTISGDACIRSCRALQSGGAIYLGGGLLTVEGGRIEKNRAELSGGAAYVTGGNVEITGGTIYQNVAHENGGGVAVNNGNVEMSGGSVEENRTESGNGGGIFVSAFETDVEVSILSGSVLKNASQQHGGAVAVLGGSGEENIKVTVGVNLVHFLNGVRVDCVHGSSGSLSCPVVQKNTSVLGGGAIYITGGLSTALNIYCVEEQENLAEDGKSRSNFMLVEGGKVVLSTADPENLGGDSSHGRIVIHSSIQVTAGQVDLYGSMANPVIDAPITVDIKSSDDHYRDHRTNMDDVKYYKLQYFENFWEPGADSATGQYTVYQIPHGETHTISGVIYSHAGYEIIGWFTGSDGSGDNYGVGVDYVFDGSPGDLAIYAIWQEHSYFIEFLPGVPEGTLYYGSMEKTQFTYNTEAPLPQNQFQYPGYIFVEWKGSNGETYADRELILNLTGVDSEVIQFVAIWRTCPHKTSDPAVTITYTKDANVITCACSCLGFSETATLHAESVTYDTFAHPATVLYSGSDWGLSILHTRAGVGEADPINAGSYTASITVGGATAELTFEIYRAHQPDPTVPQFEVVGNQLNVTPVISTVGTQALYQLVYYKGSASGESGWQSSAQFTLSDAYTSYCIRVKFGEDAEKNYYESDVIQSLTVYFYKGNVQIQIVKDNGIAHTIEISETPAGLWINLTAESGFFLHNLQGSTTEGTLESHTGYRFLLSGISDAPMGETKTVTVTIHGAQRNATVESTVAPRQIFGQMPNPDGTVRIGCDSAFTVLFTLSNYQSYTDPSLAFSTALPADTTLILLDRATGTYWYCRVGSAAASVPLASFVRMGDVDGFGEGGFAEELSLQFIIDFSQTATGAPAGDLTVSFAAIAIDAEVPALPTAAQTLQLEEVTTYLSSVQGPVELDPLEKNLELSPAISEGILSKWEGRATALLVTLISDTALPPDARLRAEIGNASVVFYPTRDGRFIVALPAGTELLSLSLESDMFPMEQSSYTLQIQLLASRSASSYSPLGGEERGEALNLSYVSAETPEPSLSVTGRERLLALGSTLNVQVTYADLEDCTVTATLMLRGEDGSYSSTGLVTNVKDQGALAVPLAGQESGNYSLVLTVKDEAETTILTVPYYFIILSE